MSLVHKLILYALAVALLPLAATGFSLIRLGESALRERIEQHQQSTVLAVAAHVSHGVEDLAERIAAVLQQWDPTALTVPERQGLLLALYRLSSDVSVTLLADERGEMLAPAVLRQAGEEPGAGQIGHPLATDEDVARLRDYVNEARTSIRRRHVVLISPVYFVAQRSARVSVAIPSAFGEGESATAVAGIEIELGERTLQIEGADTGRESVLFVVNADGRVISHPHQPAGADLSAYPPVVAFLRRGRQGIAHYRVDTGSQAAAFAPIGKLGWGVIVEQPEKIAFAAAARMREQTLAWILATVAVVLLSGFIFAGRIRRNLMRLVGGARRFSGGELSHRIEVGSTDEVRELAETMNSMAAALAISLNQLEEWNQTLEMKVERRTRELQSAQAQLLTQSKLAAIGRLGAGIAHEINNPLTAVIGACQLLLAGRDPQSHDAKRLRLIEDAAGRCRSIVARMLALSERRSSGPMCVAVNEVVEDVAELFQGGLAGASIELVRDLDPEAGAVTMDRAQVELVLINLIANARTAMPGGGRLTLGTRSRSDGAEITVRDTGLGIEQQHLGRIFEPFFTTKTEWTAVGLGLSVAYQIVMDHSGRIDVQSEPGKGATFVVFLPTDPGPRLSAASARVDAADGPLLR